MALIKELKGFTPEFGKNCFLAENAVIIGDVKMGDNCSIWYSVVIRGDVHYIRIGNNVNIQDGAIIHCTYKIAPTNIGNSVSIAHGAIVHGCTIEDNVLIGMNAVILDNAVVKSNTIIAAGSVVTKNSILEANSIYAGIPAKKIKDISPELSINEIKRIADSYLFYTEWYKE